ATFAQKPPRSWFWPVAAIAVIGELQSEASAAETPAQTVFASPVCVAQNPCVRVVWEANELSKVQVTVVPRGMLNAQLRAIPPTTVAVPNGLFPSTEQKEAVSDQLAGGADSVTPYEPGRT